MVLYHLEEVVAINSINILHRTIFGRAGLILAAKFGPPDQILATKNGPPGPFFTRTKIFVKGRACEASSRSRKYRRAPGFLELLLSAKVCVCVSAPEAINN